MPSTTALVTGATKGIGRATALALGRAGYAVGVTARTRAAVDGLVAELGAAGIRAAGRAADVADPDAVAGLVDHVTGALGPIDTLVNNAGLLVAGPFLEMTVAEWDTTFATNVRGLYLVTRAVLPGMIERGRGDIVNVASLAARNGVPGAVAYSASKHAVLGFSRSLLLEVRDRGVRVMAICPGSVDTAMLREQRVFPTDFQRILRAEDVAQAILDVLQVSGRATVSELDVRPSFHRATVSELDVRRPSP
jgi:3-oxoacyl-[acyl-carrier protein] reductase